MVHFVNEITSNRCFRVLINGLLSQTRNLKNGIPQWSVSASALFILYIADLPHTSGMKLAYAEDVAIIKICDTFQRIEQALSRDIYTMHTYYHQR